MERGHHGLKLVEKILFTVVPARVTYVDVTVNLLEPLELHVA